MSVYKENGYENRKDYLLSLVDMYGVEQETVFYLASILGANEDFDGLVTQLEDMHSGW